MDCTEIYGKWELCDKQYDKMHAYFIPRSVLLLLYIMMKISKYRNYDKTSFDLSNVEYIIRHNNDTYNFIRFEKWNASLYRSLILRVISNHFTTLLLNTDGLQLNIYFSHFISRKLAYVKFYFG